MSNTYTFDIDFTRLDEHDAQIVRNAIEQLKEERSEPEATDEECLVEILHNWMQEVWCA